MSGGADSLRSSPQGDGATGALTPALLGDNRAYDPSIVYLDHAATSWPKQAAVLEAMSSYLDTAASPGRSGHRLARCADEWVWRARDALARLLGDVRAGQIAFMPNATMGMNVAIRSVADDVEYILTSNCEHNSIVRPVHALCTSTASVTWDQIHSTKDGTLDVDDLRRKVAARRPDLLAVSHASNVTGVVQPVEEVSAIAATFDVPLLVDAAQTVGAFPLDVARLPRIDYVAISGHKAIGGPVGTGALYVADHAKLKALVTGGTGTSSDSFAQPEFLPDALETGTGNGVGIAGLAAGAETVLHTGVDIIRAHESELRDRLTTGLHEIEDITVVADGVKGATVGVVSFTMRGYSPGELCFQLDNEFAVLVRAGLHCAPLTHRSLGTLPEGTVRLSVGPTTTVDDVDSALAALRTVSDRRGTS